MVSFIDAVKICALRKPVTIKGRAPRSEFWWYYLAIVLAGFVFGLLIPIPFLGPLLYLAFTIFSIVTFITVTVRRLHDINRSGWWIIPGYLAMFLISAIGIVASSETIISLGFILVCGPAFILYIVLLVFSVLPGTKGPNRFGPDPLAASAQPVPAAAAPAQPTAAPAPEAPQQPIGADGDFTKIEK